MKGRNIFFALISVVALFLVIWGVVSLTSYNSDDLTYEQATKKLDGMVEKVAPLTVEPIKSTLEFSEVDLKDELPDISTNPFVVEGRGDIDIEIFATTEKASTNGVETDNWLTTVAENFNREKVQLNGKTISVSVRPIASGLGLDYIISGKYLPDAYTPSNSLWGDMLVSKNVKVECVAEKLVGNVAGMLVRNEVYDALLEKYKEVNLKTILEAVNNNEMVMGYTDPFSSATGMNFLISTLSSFDSKNPLSENAVTAFEQFQKNIPFLASTTLQMREAALSGSFDAFLTEYQSYVNTTKFRDFTFVPFGVAHNNPLYAIGELSSETKEAIEIFSEYCLNTDSQKLATKYGFNQDEYKTENKMYDGNVLLEAQSVWKQKKDSGRTIAAVFVADISGSMDGEPLMSLKESLLNVGSYINDDNLIGLVSYSDDTYINLPVKKFDMNQQAYFKGAVENLSAGGGTSTFDAILVAMDMLLEVKASDPNAKLMLFVLSDGETNSGYSLSAIESVVKAVEIPIYTIAYNSDISRLEEISAINEAATIKASSEDIVYKLKSLFNVQM